MIVFGILLATAYVGGLLGTLHHFEEQPLPKNPAMYLWWAFMTEFWPVYWTGRLLARLPNPMDLLMLPPGDPPP